MAQTAEGRVKKVINKVLKAYGAYKFMPVQSGMGRQGLDYHCAYFGRAFFIEAKAPGKVVTVRQDNLIAELTEQHMCPCFVIDDERAQTFYPLMLWFYHQDQRRLNTDLASERRMLLEAQIWKRW